MSAGSRTFLCLRAPSARSRAADRLFHGLAAACAALVLLIMAGFFVELVLISRPAMKAFGARFLVSRVWDPVQLRFGALSSIYGTLVSTAIAMLIATPLSLAIALFLTELAPAGIRRAAGAAIELLAAVPSIIYGMWGLFVFAPFLERWVQPPLQKAFGFLPLFQGAPIGIGMLTAGLILALMVLPFMSAVMRDVFSMTPAVLKESAYGMGSTTWEVARKVLMPYGLQGLVGAGFLGLGRAIGETMAVTFVIGNTHDIALSLFAPGNTIASTLANEFTEAVEELYTSALVELGLILFILTFALQLLAHLMLRRLARKMGVR